MVYSRYSSHFKEINKYNLRGLITTCREFLQFDFPITNEKIKQVKFPKGSPQYLFTGRRKLVEYKITAFDGKVYTWKLGVEFHVKRRFGEFSPEYRRIHKILIDKKTQFVLANLNSKTIYHSHSDNTKQTITRLRKRVISDTREILGRMLIELQKMHSESIKKDSYGFDEIGDAATLIMKDVRFKQNLKYKLTGFLYAQGIQSELLRIANTHNIKIKLGHDDIQHLASQIKDKLPKGQLKTFFSKRFKDISLADTVRNQSCHVYESAPSRARLSVCKDLLVELQEC